MLCVWVLFLAATFCLCQESKVTVEKPRVIVLTDFFKDPDDKQSLVRFLLYTNEFDVRGIVATSLAYGTGEVHPEWIIDMLNMYAQVQPNLLLHDSSYPSADSLKAKVKAGASMIRKYVGPGKGFETPFGKDSRRCEPAANHIGVGKDTEGSKHIINVIDESSSPTWIIVWGGAIDLAQALWKVQHTRSPAAYEAFVKKIRLYQIHWQDTGATWLWEHVPQLFRIQGLHLFRGMYQEGNPAFKNKAWVDTHIKTDHGILGAQYPQIENIDGVKEGDSPSFLYLIPTGLSDIHKPEYGGWGGRFKPFAGSATIFVDATDNHPTKVNDLSQAYWTVARWNRSANLDFAARMDWCMMDYDHANHPPQVHLNGDVGLAVKYRKVKGGERVLLNAEGTTDPDGDALHFRWTQYQEAGDLGGVLSFDDEHAKNTFFIAPESADGRTAHIVLEVTDDGVPAMTRYRRLIVNIN
ncbi:MAG: DUF1593 domain-containing protein [Saprospiraceae bacterium]|nr:DUF1593 domain-containing protein [Saprospiraceae bacterium]